MTKNDVDKVRTFALVGHGDAGKTSLTEAMLYDANMTTRLGKIEQGNTVYHIHPHPPLSPRGRGLG